MTLSSLAQFPIDGIMRPGVIKWIGVVDGISELMAGLEMVIFLIHTNLERVIFLLKIVSDLIMNLILF